MTALLDADIISYRAASVGTTSFDWGEGDGEQETVNLKLAKQVADSMVASWTKHAGEKVPLLIFSDRSYSGCIFRHRLHPEYKATRSGDRPTLHAALEKYLRDRYNWRSSPGLEGDDLMGLLATGADGPKYVIVSIDKDMLTVPAKQVNPDKDDVGKITKPTLFQANYTWMLQTLCGDTVDNYKGAPGVGEVTAKRALAGCSNLDQMWDAVLDLFETQWRKPSQAEKFQTAGPVTEALLNARMARILRHGDYYQGKIELWHPNGDYDEPEFIDAFVAQEEEAA